MSVLETAIDEDTCMDLLSGVVFGRVALSIHALPRIVPVRFAVHRGRICAHVQGTVDLSEALDGAVVALQADGYDDRAEQVWTVHLVGRVTARYDTGFVITPSLTEGEWLSG